MELCTASAVGAYVDVPLAEAVKRIVHCAVDGGAAASKPANVEYREPAGGSSGTRRRGRNARGKANQAARREACCWAYGRRYTEFMMLITRWTDIPLAKSYYPQKSGIVSSQRLTADTNPARLRPPGLDPADPISSNRSCQQVAPVTWSSKVGSSVSIRTLPHPPSDLLRRH